MELRIYKTDVNYYVCKLSSKTSTSELLSVLNHADMVKRNITCDGGYINYIVKDLQTLAREIITCNGGGLNA